MPPFSHQDSEAICVVHIKPKCTGRSPALFLLTSHKRIGRSPALFLLIPSALFLLTLYKTIGRSPALFLLALYMSIFIATSDQRSNSVSPEVPSMLAVTEVTLDGSPRDWVADSVRRWPEGLYLTVAPVPVSAFFSTQRLVC